MGGGIGSKIRKKIAKRRPNISVSYAHTVTDKVDNHEAPPNERIGRMREDGFITRKIGNNAYIARRSDVDAEAGAHDHVAHGFGDPNVATIDSWDEWFYRNGTLYKVGDKYASDLARTAAARRAKLNMAIARGLKPKTIEKLKKEANHAVSELLEAEMETVVTSNVSAEVERSVGGSLPLGGIHGMLFFAILGASESMIDEGATGIARTREIADGHIGLGEITPQTILFAMENPKLWEAFVERRGLPTVKDWEIIQAWGWTVEDMPTAPEGGKYYEIDPATKTIKIALKATSWVGFVFGYRDLTDEERADALAQAIAEVKALGKPDNLGQLTTGDSKNASGTPYWRAWQDATKLRRKFLNDVISDVKWQLALAGTGKLLSNSDELIDIARAGLAGIRAAKKRVAIELGELIIASASKKGWRRGPNFNEDRFMRQVSEMLDDFFEDGGKLWQHDAPFREWFSKRTGKRGRQHGQYNPTDNTIQLWSDADDATLLEELMHYRQAKMRGFLYKGHPSPAEIKIWEEAVERLLSAWGFIH